MTLNAKIAGDVQKPSPGELVSLFELDTSLVGGSTYRFTQSRYEDAPVRYNGDIYYPLSVEADGFEFTGKGQLPRPKIRLGLVGDGTALTLRQAIRSGNDLIGCKITRRRTFRKYLDGESGADFQAQFPLDIYVIERKAHADNLSIEWELSAYMDHEGKMIPGRQVLRDNCTHQYRIWTGSAFSYVNATCPYTGASYFKTDGTVTANAFEDDCGRRLSDCKLRFPGLPLPTRAFPGVARTRL